MPTGGQPTPWGAIATGASGLLGLIGQKGRQRRQHKYNLELADHQFAQQKSMWDEAWTRETEYNDPSAQMARYRNAGINPHMAYMSGGGQNTAETGSLPEYKQEGLEVAPSSGETGTTILSNYFRNAQMETQIRTNKAKADQEESKADLLRQGLDIKKRGETAKAGNVLLEAEQKASVLYGDRGEGKFTRYQQGLADDVELKSLQKLISKSTEALNKVKKRNLLTTDEINQIQKQIAQAQFDFLKTDWFQNLPSGIQAVFMALARKSGGVK